MLYVFSSYYDIAMSNFPYAFIPSLLDFFVYFMGVTHRETLPTFCAQDEKILVSSTKCEDEIPINKASVRDNGILDL